jgi:hypothetical protein
MRLLSWIPLILISAIVFLNQGKAEEEMKDFTIKLVKVKPLKSKKNLASKKGQHSSGRKPASKNKQAKSRKLQSKLSEKKQRSKPN